MSKSLRILMRAIRGCVQGLLKSHILNNGAVQAHPHQCFILKGLDVDIADVSIVGSLDQAVEQLDDRGVPIPPPPLPAPPLPP